MIYFEYNIHVQLSPLFFINTPAMSRFFMVQTNIISSTRTYSIDEHIMYIYIYIYK